MIDAVSVAGFSIAIFDQILKLGERTGQLIKDIKEFDEVYQLIIISATSY